MTKPPLRSLLCYAAWLHFFVDPGSCLTAPGQLDPSIFGDANDSAITRIVNTGRELGASLEDVTVSNIILNGKYSLEWLLFLILCCTLEAESCVTACVVILLYLAMCASLSGSLQCRFNRSDERGRLAFFRNRHQKQGCADLVRSASCIFLCKLEHLMVLASSMAD